MPKKLTIGRVAKQANINIETVRYYERIGLIKQPPKPASGYRVYPNETLARLRFIKRAKTLGFSLQEIAELLELDAQSCNQTKAYALHKLQSIRTKIDDLQSLANTLENLVEACEENNEVTTCPIISAIIDDDSF